MTYSGLPSLAAAALFLILATGCNKKVQIQYQAEQAKLSITELQAQSKRLDAEIQATGNLGGRYQTTLPGHLNELRQMIENTKAESEQLKNENEAVKEKLRLLQKEMETYLAKFRS